MSEFLLGFVAVVVGAFVGSICMYLVMRNNPKYLQFDKMLTTDIVSVKAKLDKQLADFKKLLGL